MSMPSEMVDRHSRLLAELAELCLASARDLTVRQLAAEDGEATADCALALHRVGRSLRQTVALDARLERERHLAAREDHAEFARQTQARVEKHKAQVNAAMERLVWTEYEHNEDEGYALLEKLEQRLDEAVLDDSFTEAPVEAHIARLCKDLGLSSSPSAERDQGEVSIPPPLGVACEARGAGSQSDPGDGGGFHSNPSPSPSVSPVSSVVQNHDPQDPTADDDWRSSA